MSFPMEMFQRGNTATTGHSLVVGFWGYLTHTCTSGKMTQSARRNRFAFGMGKAWIRYLVYWKSNGTYV